MSHHSAFIGIAGGSGSGKTTIANALAESHPSDQVQLIALDAYYKDRKGMSLEDRARINYDHPDAFDQDLLMQHIITLKSGGPIEQPIYDYALHERTEETVLIYPSPVIILEGILVLALDAVRPLLDLKLFVDTDADVRFLRRMRRDVAERGRSVRSVMGQYLETVRPMHDRYIEPTRAHADLILPGEADYGVLVEVLGAWVTQKLTASKRRVREAVAPGV